MENIYDKRLKEYEDVIYSTDSLTKRLQLRTWIIGDIMQVHFDIVNAFMEKYKDDPVGGKLHKPIVNKHLRLLIEGFEKIKEMIALSNEEMEESEKKLSQK